MKSVRLLGLLFALGLAVSTAPAYADGTASHSKAVVNWQQRDTAVYVVSTLNLLNRSRSHTMQQVLQGLGVTHIDVYADNARPDLYFIELMHDDGIAGSLAYRMGWPKPKRISWASGKRIPAAAIAIAQAYRTDTKTLIGSFTSTLPQ